MMILMQITAGEVLITNPNGGAIALVTTSRLVFSSSNRIINNSYIQNLLPVGGSVPTIGEALRRPKMPFLKMLITGSLPYLVIHVLG